MGAYLPVMMHTLRIFFGLILALTVALTAHSAAARQGERDAAGRIVICTGTGPVAIYVDSEGQPVTPPHSCPDCMMHVLDAVTPPVTLGLPVGGCSTASTEFDAAQATVQFIPDACARAPPPVA